MSTEGFWAKQARLFGAELAALGREGLKDARTLVMGEWGKGCEEPGTLGNPTQMMVNEQFDPAHAAGYEDWLKARSEAAPACPGPEREMGE